MIPIKRSPSSTKFEISQSVNNFLVNKTHNATVEQQQPLQEHNWIMYTYFIAFINDDELLRLMQTFTDLANIE